MLRKPIEGKVIDFKAFSKDCWKCGGAVKRGAIQYGKIHFTKNSVHFHVGAHRAMYVVVHKTMPADLPLDIPSLS